MAIIQVALEVPDDVCADLRRGELIRRGGVVRDVAGQIVVHLKEVDLVDEKARKIAVAEANAMEKQNRALLKQRQQLAEQAAQHAKQNRAVLIGVGIIAVAVAVGGTADYVIKRRKATVEAKYLSEVQTTFNDAIRVYLDSLCNGLRDEVALAKVIANVDEVRNALNDKSLTMEFSDEQLDALVMILKNYTEQLANANRIELVDPSVVASSDGVSNVILLRHYLGEQQGILEVA